MLWGFFFVLQNVRAQDFTLAERHSWELKRMSEERHWEGMVSASRNEWEALRREVEKKWQEFIHSTQKTWVEYNTERDARSLVDFERGEIVIETVIREGDSQALSKARQKIKQQAHKVFTYENGNGNTLLADQVLTKGGERVDFSNLAPYIEEELLRKVTPEPSSFLSADGIKRRKYNLIIHMIPEHVLIRAQAHLPTVKRYAAHFRLDPELVLSIIHTESFFNPLAISNCGAIGMMQVVPENAGREAYLFVFGKDTLPSREYLYDPRNNIELGSAYLHLLKYRHFEDVPWELKNEYLVICGYNWGPTSVRREVVNKHPIRSMSEKDLYALLRDNSPHETRQYIQKVTEKLPMYKALLNEG